MKRFQPAMQRLLLQRPYCAYSNLDELLEPYFVNGLTNYSSSENKKKIASLVEKNLDPRVIKVYLLKIFFDENDEYFVKLTV